MTKRPRRRAAVSFLLLASTYEEQSPDRVVSEDEGGDEEHRSAEGFIGCRLEVRSVTSSAAEAVRVQAWSGREQHGEVAMREGA